MTFLVDTGSDGWLSIDPAELEGSGIELAATDPAYSVIGAGAAGTFEARIQFVLADLDIGGQQLDNVPLATLESLSAGEGNIGNDFLSHYVVTLDWPNETLYLDPLSDDPQPSVRPSASLSWDGEQVIVGSLTDGVPGYEGTVELGATVEAIDDQDLSSATFEEFCDLLTTGLPDTYQMTLAGDGVTVQVAPIEDFYEAPAG